MKQLVEDAEQHLAREPQGSYIEEAPVGSVNVGPVKIDYGSIWLDALAGMIIIALVGAGYYWKKKIDKKFKD